jgi:hypothetical protein
MSIESTILLENITQEVSDSTFSFSEKQKGSGYHKLRGGLHTYVYQLDSFVGVIKLQGTLELYPGEADWVDINDTTVSVGSDSTMIGSTTGNFSGNFVWIRAAYNLQDGTITQLRYNH